MLSRPQLGVSSWIFGARPLPEIAALLQELVFDGAAVHGMPSRMSPAALRDLFDQHGLSIFALTPENVDLAHPEAGVRQAAVDHYLALLDAAAAAGVPVVQVQPAVGRLRPLTSTAAEQDFLLASLATLTERAAILNIRLAFHALNRYETFLGNNGAAARAMIDAVDAGNLGLMLSAFHMNIEEQDAAGAIRAAGDKLFLYAMADSNRQAIGRGHIKLGDHLWALEDIGYAGPILFEFFTPGADPWLGQGNATPLLDEFLAESRRWF
jgi:D-psicose/D-tagatose/L-ribulose 3-epimerase